MKGIIWYKTKESGFNRLNKLIKDYAKMNIFILGAHKNSSSCEIRFSNDDVWHVVPATDHSRGRACSISLIERDIDPEIIHSVIMPTIKAYPYQAYNYYSYETYGEW